VVQIDVAHWAIWHTHIAEEDVTVQVRAFPRAAPFECRKSGELTRLISVLCRSKDNLPRAKGSLVAGEKRRMLRSRRTIALDHVIQEPFLLLLHRLQASQFRELNLVVSRSTIHHRRIHLADVLGVIGDSSPVQRLMEFHLNSSNLDFFPFGETVSIGGQEPRAGNIGVKRVGRVKKAGFIVGVSYGRGLMSCRSGENLDGPWSAPTMMQSTGDSFGLQAGATPPTS